MKLEIEVVIAFILILIAISCGVLKIIGVL